MLTLKTDYVDLFQLQMDDAAIDIKSDGLSEGVVAESKNNNLLLNLNFGRRPSAIRSSKSASLWKAKGITPIEFLEYDDIYVTLAEWARYAMNPTAYSRFSCNLLFSLDCSYAS